MAGSKRKADMAISATDELSETYEAEGAETIVHETEGGAGDAYGYGYGYGYGHDYGYGYGNEDVLANVVKDEEDVTQAKKGPDEGKGAESTDPKDRRPSIMDGNLAEWEACAKDCNMTPSQASRIAVAMGLSGLKRQQHKLGEPEVESKRLAKKPRVDPDPISHLYAHQGPTTVPMPMVDPENPISHVYAGPTTVPTTPRVDLEDVSSHAYAHDGPTNVPTTPRVDPEDLISHVYAHQGPTAVPMPRVDPENPSFHFNAHQGLATVPTRARPHSTRSQHRNTSTLSTSTNAGPSKPTPAYEKCSNCGTMSLPADNPALERRCKDCGQLFFPSRHETPDYAQAHVSPYAPLPLTNLLNLSSLLQSGSSLGSSQAPVPTRIRWLFQNGKYCLVNDSGQPIDAAGELVDYDYFLIDPITKVRRLDLFRRDMHGRAYPEPRTNDHVPVDADSQTG